MTNMDLIVKAEVEGIDELFTDIDSLAERLDDLRINFTFEEKKDDDMFFEKEHYALEETIDLQTKLLIAALGEHNLTRDRDSLADNKVLLECLFRLIRLPEADLNPSLRNKIKYALMIKNSELHMYLRLSEVNFEEIKGINSIVELLSRIIGVIDYLD